MSTGSQENIPENKMGTMSINKLLISMSLPMVISMLVQSLYNIVDSIFVARLSEDALTAVSLAFPVQNLMISVAIGTAVGMNALLSRSLGERNFKTVNNAAKNGILLAFLGSILFLIIGLTCTKLYFDTQTDIQAIRDYGTTYLTICCTLSFGVFGQVMFERILQSTGKTFLAMISQITGAVVNIILDPILIFGLLGAPAMGVAGAAIATVIGQFCGMCLSICLNLRKNKEVKLSFKGFRPQKATIIKIYSVGLPSIIMMSIGSIMVFGVNRILMAFTSTAVAVFGVYFKLQSFIFMPVFGINNGLVPIVSYNHGARKKERVIKAIKLAMVYACSLMLIGFAIFQIFPEQLFYLFNASSDMLEIGIPALRTISYSFILAGFCIICSTVFQALGKGVASMICSIVRQLVALLPAAKLLSLLGNVDLVWIAFPVAELFSLAISIYFLRKVYKSTILPLDISRETTA